MSFSLLLLLLLLTVKWLPEIAGQLYLGLALHTLLERPIRARVVTHELLGSRAKLPLAFIVCLCMLAPLREAERVREFIGCGRNPIDWSLIQGDDHSRRNQFGQPASDLSRLQALTSSRALPRSSRLCRLWRGSLPKAAADNYLSARLFVCLLA